MYKKEINGGFQFITAHERYPRVNSSYNWRYSPRCRAYSEINNFMKQ